MALTEEQHIKLVEVGEQFRDELATSAAKALSQLPKEIRQESIYYLQDCTSLFQPGTFDRIAERIK